MSRPVRRSLLFLAALSVAVTMLPASPASAHPLGNFTINVYAGIVVQPQTLVVDYVVDMAEIPAFRERRTIDVNLDDRIDEAESIAYREATCAASADGLAVKAAGQRVPLMATDVHGLTFPAGAGGLTTLRLECRLQGEAAIDTNSTALTLLDRTFADAIGWREVTAVGDGVSLTGSDVPTVSTTDRLSSYPSDGASSDVRSASLEATLGGPRLSALPGPGSAPAAPSEPRDAGLLADLVGRDDLTPLLVGAMLLVAVGVGALHALGPGHGKTLIGAYLVGAGGSIRHAVGVGAAVSVMHTASVLTLGLLVLSAERVFAPERVYPVLGLASGCIALALGAALLVSRIHAMTHDGGPAHRHEHGVAGSEAQAEEDPHSHSHDPDNSAAMAGSPLSRRGLLALAFSGGILPSPSALVVLLASMTLGRTVLGLVLIVAFSLGLAGALIGFGILTLRARDMAERRLTTTAARLLPVGSAAVIAAMGLFLTIRGVSQL